MRALTTIAPILASALAACSPYSPKLPEEPFLCGDTDPVCPDGFSCVTDGSGTKVCTATSGGSGDVDAGHTGSCSDDSMLEPNGTFASAFPTTVVSQRASIDLADLAICPNGDVDFYSFTVGDQQNADAVVTYAASGSPLQMTVFVAEGAGSGTSIKNATAVSGSADTIEASVANRAQGTYYIEVFGPTTGGTNPNYELKLTVSGP